MTEGEREEEEGKEKGRARGSLASNVPSGRSDKRMEGWKEGGERREGGKQERGQSTGRKFIPTFANTPSLYCTKEAHVLILKFLSASSTAYDYVTRL